jgi:hypothetical protein
MFKDFFKETDEDFTFNVETPVNEVKTSIDDKIKKIRDADIKIKLINPTNFGIEVIFYNEADAKEAAEIIDIPNSDIDIKGKSIFIKKI